MKNQPTHNINLDKKSKWYKFDKGVEVWANYHQILHSKQYTPKFFKDSPMHPGQKPNDNKTNFHALIQRNKKEKN